MNLYKIFSKQIISIVIFMVLVLSLVLFSDVFPNRNSALIIENTGPVPAQEQVVQAPKRPSYGLPIRLKIPSINVDSGIEYVGLADDGAMDVPKERSNVAWFNLGSRPGNDGSAVISGHYGRQNGKGSVFDDLHKLRKGDKVYAEDEKGVTISFVVREVQRYDPANPKTDGAEIFGSFDGKPHLNLITCEGVWDENTQQYSKRLVVFTDIVI